MRKHNFRRSVALLLSLLLLGQSAYAVELVEAYTPDYKYFETMEVPQDYQDQDLFWFGSTDMTVSEQDPDYYVMRVLRSGSCDSDASITVKFTDLTADYGENYTVWTYDDHTEPADIGDVPAMVDFMQENSDTLTEEEPYTEEDLIEAMETENGVNLQDKLGDTIANLTVSDVTSGDAASEVADTLSAETKTEAADGILDGVIDAADYAAIDAEQETLYSDNYPGHELTLDFAPGETEKLIVVDPKDSSAADGDCVVTASLKNPSEGMAYLEEDMTTSITITDEDPQTPATLSIEKTEYFADSDTVAVTITRTGAINDMVYANLVTASDEAEMGVDYQGADAKLYFPMGIVSRTVELQVNHIRDEQLTFQVELVNPVGCTLINDSATVTIATAAEADAVAAAAEAAAEAGNTGLLKDGTVAAVTMSAFSDMSELMAEHTAAANGSAAAETTAEPEAEATAEEPTAEPEAEAAADEAAPADEAEPADEAAPADEAETTDEAETDYSDVPYIDTEDAAAPEGTGVEEAEGEEEEATAELSDSLRLPDSDIYRLGDALNVYDFEKIGKGWIDDSGAAWFYSCKGSDAPYDSWNGIKYAFSNPYLYDGVRVKVDGDHSYVWCNCTTHITMDGSSLWSTDSNEYSTTVDAIFTKADNTLLKVEAQTTSWNGLYGTIHYIKPIYRKFNFTLADPTDADGNALTFAGVSSADAMKYTATALINGSNNECSSEILSINDQLTLAGQDVHGYVTLKAVQFLDSDGNVLATVDKSASDPTNTMQMTLTDSLLNQLATSHTTFKKDSAGYYVGQIQVRPVYEHVTAKVSLQSTKYGQFTGDYAQPQTLTMNLGDELTLSSAVNSSYDGKYVADGIHYVAYESDGVTLRDSGSYDYLTTDGTRTITVNAPVMTLSPVFKEANNAVEVYVKVSDLSKLSSDSLLLNASRVRSGEYYVYTLSSTSVHVGALVIAAAKASDSSQVPLWTVGNQTWSGNTFAFTADREKDNNRIYLTFGKAVQYTMSGYAYNGDRNLSMLNSISDPVIPATNAAIACSDVGTTPDETGYFSVSGVTGSPDTLCRVVLYSNNSFTVKDVSLNDSEKAINLGKLLTSVNTVDTAHFTGVTVTQDGVVVTSASRTIAMDSKKLTVSVTVEDGNTYLLNDQQYTETATGVTFYILDSETHGVKYALPAKSNGDGSWTASIEKFTPDQADNWYYGDLIYAELTTDRKQSAGLDDNGNVIEGITSTTYAMLCTGYEIVSSDLPTEAQTIELDPQLDADSVLGDAAVSEDTTGTQTTGRTTRAYRTIPFLGGINFFLKLTGSIHWFNSASGSESALGDDYVPSTGVNSMVQVKISATIEELPYGGQRLKLGVMAKTGDDTSMGVAGANPYNAYKVATYGKADTTVAKPGTTHLRYTRPGYSLYDQVRGSFGVPQMTVTFTLGLYVDFGLKSTITDTKDNNVEYYNDGLVVLGAGGYFGASGSVEWQFPFMCPPGIPMYAGLVGSLGFTAYFGTSADVLKELNSEDTGFDIIKDENGNFSLNKLHFNVDVVGSAGVKGYFGVGIADILGGRIIAGLNVVFEFCPELKNYYPAIDDTWGLTVNFTVGGQIDLVFMSIPLDGFSIPITSQGFSEYFTYIRRSYRLWDYMHEALEVDNSYTEEQIKQLNAYMDTLVNDMNNVDSSEQLLNDYNAAYDYADSLGILTASKKVALTMITELDIYTLEDDGSTSAGTTEAAGSGNTQEVNEDGYFLMEHTESNWVANDSAALSGSYTEAYTTTLVEDSYSQPSASMMDIGNNCLLSVYLTDTSEAGETLNPTLVYTIYHEDTQTWDDPVTIEDDGTADYTPSLCDAGDQVIITWSSAGTADQSDPKAVLESMEVKETTFDKDTQTVGTPVLLTSDQYLDYNPKAIYDNETGDIAVYYIKSTTTAATDLLTYVQGNSLLCYRLYDAETGTWLTSYLHEEYEDMTDEELETQGTKYGGQRFLSSSVADDSPITDLTVCTGYNGLGIYAYTVDADGDTSDTSDTELYMRVYDFRTHKTYAPIRITDDDVSQAEPQLVRSTGSYTDSSRNEDGTAITVDGCTYLFWLEDGDTVNYISVTDLLRHGINSDGSLKDGALDYTSTPIDFSDADGVNALVSNYQAIADASDDLYLVWSQATDSEDEEANENITTPAPEEVFASALIPEAPTSSYDPETCEGGSVGSSWSDPVRLTTDEGHNDGVSGVIGSDDNLYIMHTEYDITYVGFAEDAAVDEETGCIAGNPYVIGDTDLCFSAFTPDSTIVATEFTYSDDTPAPGDTITVTAKVENTGLATAMGYTMIFAECRDGIEGDIVATYSQNDWLNAGSADYATFDWTVPEDFDQVCFICSGYELGYEDPALSYSEPLEKKDAYDLSIGTVTQTGDTFSAEYTLTNTGSLTAADSTVLRAEFTGLYGHYDTFYGLDTDNLGELSLAGLAPGETKSGTMELSVPEQAFDYCGFDQVELTVYDSEDNALSDTVSNYLVLEAPIGTELTGDTSLEAGETTTLTAAMNSKFLQNRSSKVIYTTSDNSVASVSEDGTVTAQGAGTATITATFSPYGTTAELEITVTGERPASHQFTDVPEDAYYTDSVYWAVGKGIVYGATDTTFEPDSGCTRAQFVTFLWRAAGEPAPTSTVNKFKDVDASEYYYDAVLWCVEKGIVYGTSDTTFEPNTTCTRAQAATFLYRYALEPAPAGSANKFTDVSTSDYYYEATLWGSENGIIYGTGDTTFAPNTTCTRAQAVTFLYRLLNR